MSNAAKHRKKAAEFEQLKQIDRAIAMYIKAIDDGEAEGEEIDVALLNKVGDLTLRQGRVADAVTYYERAVEHYATSGLFNNAIALCNKILRSAPGRSTVYFTLGRICAKKGLRGDATRNFLEYATRMQQDGRIDEGMRALAEVADLMPELTEVRRLVDEHAARVGITIPKRQTPAAATAAVASGPGTRRSDKSSELVFLEVDAPMSTRRNTPPLAPRVSAPLDAASSVSLRGGTTRSTPARGGAADGPRSGVDRSASLDAFLLFDPTRPGAVTPPGAQRAVAAAAATKPANPSPEIPATDRAPDSSTSEPAAAQSEPHQAVPSDLPAVVVSEPATEPVAEMPLDLVLEMPATTGEPIVVADSDSLVAAAEEGPEIQLDRATDERESDVAPEAPQVVYDIDQSGITGIVYVAAYEVTPEVSSLESEVGGDPDGDVTLPGGLDVASQVEAVSDTHVEPLAGLESMDAGAPIELPMLDGWSSHRVDELDEALPIGTALGWRTPADAMPTVPEPAGFASHAASLDAIDDGVVPLPDLVVEDFEHVADDPNVFVVTGSRAGTPAYGTTFPRSLTPIDVSPIPELDAAIEAGALVAARAEADPTLTLRRPPFRIDPHDFILPGELPPLMADDELDAVVVAPSALAAEETVEAVDADSTADVARDADAPLPVEPPASPEDALDDALEGADAAPTATHDPTQDAALEEPTADAVQWTSDADVRDGAATPPDGAIFEAIDLDEVEGPSYPSHVDAPEEAPVDLTFETSEGSAEDVALVADPGVPELEFDETPAEIGADVHLDADVDAMFEPLADAPDDVENDRAITDAAATTGESVVDLSGESVAEFAVATPEAESLQPEVDGAPSDGVEATGETEAADAAVEEAPTEPAVIVEPRVRAGTPAVPIATIAAEAQVAARARYEALQQAVSATPQDWTQRRRLAEALFEAGMPDRGFAELQAALSGLSQSGQLTAAAEIADELVRISPDRIAYHQKRVELAVRMNDQQRLRIAYLDLADTLVRAGDEARAHAVYARVLELDPWDGRAREALGAAAPPPPPTAAPEEDFVDLAEWLRDDEPASTRMRMREPVVSGDEQADFDSLLRHFKEGVSRSLGEDDFESHYDLGVAYKEMGLLDDAIAEFQKALRSRRHRLPAYEALGQCFVEQSRHSVAATVLTRALHEPGLGDEHRVGVLYLLAYSCEALQRWDEARSYYSRVYATDIHFRDVAARLAALDLIAR